VNDAAPRLLVLGAGRESLPVLQALKALGCHLAVLDGVPDAPGFRVADAGLLASTFDEESTVEAARAYAARTRLDGVLGTTRRVGPAVAMVADALGLPGPSLGAARCVADRLAMKTRLRAAGVPVPWSARVWGPSALRQIAGVTAESLVVKPVDGWAARGVVRLLKGVDLAWAHRVALLSSPSGRAMVEAYAVGRQLSVVALVWDGEVTIVDVAERCTEAHERFAPFVLDSGHERPAVLSAAQQVALDALLRASVEALAVDAAVVTGEVVLGANGPVLVDLELGLVDGRRLAHEIPLATGVDVIGAALRLALGAPLRGESLAPRWLRPVAERAVFGTPGTVVAVRDAELAAHDAGVTLVEMLVAPGSRVLPPTSNLCHGGAVVATGESRDQAVARAVAAAARIRIVTTADPQLRPPGS
jgi:biotin carboxylase